VYNQPALSVILLMAAVYRHSDGCLGSHSGSKKALPVCYNKNSRARSTCRLARAS